jgi:hypothetical protein
MIYTPYIRLLTLPGTTLISSHILRSGVHSEEPQIESGVDSDKAAQWGGQGQQQQHHRIKVSMRKYNRGGVFLVKTAIPLHKDAQMATKSQFFCSRSPPI